MGRMIDVDLEGEGFRPVSLDAIRTGAVIIVSQKESRVMLHDTVRIIAEGSEFRGKLGKVVAVVRHGVICQLRVRIDTNVYTFTEHEVEILT